MTAQSSIIEKSIAVLDVVGDANRPQTFTEIVKTSGFNKSTVHRLLSILTAEGLLQYDEDTKTYMLGHKLLQLAKKAWRGFDIQSVALSDMVRLHEIARENVSIGVLQGSDVVHLRMIESQYHWGISPVMREPAHTTATGKAIVASLPQEILSAWLDRQSFTRSTKRSITSRKAFEKELARVRAQGFATCDREEMDYVVGIAAPIFNFLGEPVAALNIWAPTDRCALVDLLAWTEALKSAADHVTELIGGHGAGEDLGAIPVPPRAGLAGASTT